MNFSPENVALDYALGAMGTVASGSLISRDEAGVFKALCDGIVTHDSYPLAWVTLVENTSTLSFAISA